MQHSYKDYYFSEAKYLKLDMPVPYENMHKEAVALKDRFTSHRDDETHAGWKSLALYGLAEDRHESWQDYGYTNAVEAAKDFIWTPAATECPTIINWLQNKFPSNRFGRVRLMLVEAGGFIGLHSDTNYKILENINIPLNNPKECLWHWGDGQTFYMEPGGVYAMNISYEHAVYNHSDEDRYHLIVARHDSTNEWKEAINTAALLAGTTGHYETHEIKV